MRGIFSFFIFCSSSSLVDSSNCRLALSRRSKRALSSFTLFSLWRHPALEHLLSYSRHSDWHLQYVSNSCSLTHRKLHFARDTETVSLFVAKSTVQHLPIGVFPIEILSFLFPSLPRQSQSISIPKDPLHYKLPPDTWHHALVCQSANQQTTSASSPRPPRFFFGPLPFGVSRTRLEARPYS